MVNIHPDRHPVRMYDFLDVWLIFMHYIYFQKMESRFALKNVTWRDF